MTKFILLYRGPATDMREMSEEQSKEVMGAWAVWMESVGNALVDVGQPMANGQAVADDGSDSSATQLNGYSIVQAEDMDAAMAMAKTHPFLSEGQGRFAVEVHELMPTPEMQPVKPA